MQQTQQLYATPDKQQDTQDRLLLALEHLLAIDALDVKSALNEASDVLVNAMRADKIDVFVLDPHRNTLVSIGLSNTPMSAKQQSLGLDMLPVANGGREVEVYETGKAYMSSHADLDDGMLPGMKYELGVRSAIMMPLVVDGDRRGTIAAVSQRAEAFNTGDMRFMQGVAGWIGMVMHRAELVELNARDAAEQAKRTTADELITTLAHDLNNHLTPLSGRIQLASRRAEREGREDDIRDLREASRVLSRLREMIRDMLDIERLERGIVSITKTPVDLSALVQQVAQTMHSDRCPVNVQLPQRSELVSEADPIRLRQALENLVSNAIKHSPDSVGVEVRLQLELRADGEWAAITVRDRGPGVPTELVPRLFERFTAGPDSSGLGLGLYLARSIAQVHGGSLELEQDYTDGASFRLSLPVTPVQ
jgi:two-component system OmpR family sensor kinase